MKQRIAIVGAGAAGLTTAYLLNERYDVTVLEKSNRLGGNAWTIVTRDGEEVDIAVSAFGKVGFEHLFELFDRLKIKTAPYLCYASFYNLDTKTGLYVTPSLRGLFLQRFALFRAAHLKELFHLLQVVKKARRLLSEGAFSGMTLREALEMLPYMTGYTKLLLLSAVYVMSSMKYEAALDSPAEYCMRLLDAHNDLLSLRSPLSIVGIEKKTNSYVEALVSEYRERIIVNFDIDRVVRSNNKIVVWSAGEKHEFEKIVFACNSDQALALLDDPTSEEKRLLGAWRYNENPHVVHRDHSSFPRRPLLGGYTFLYTERNGVLDGSVNGGVWHEPGVSKKCELIVAQNPNYPINPELIELETTLRTPIYDFNSYSTIDELPSLNGVKNTYYCGSYFGLGLHEDAVRSGVEVARMLGVDFWNRQASSVLR